MKIGSGGNVRQVVENIAVDRQINVTRGTNANIVIEWVVNFQKLEEIEHFVFSDTKVFVSRRISCAEFSNHQNV